MARIRSIKPEFFTSLTVGRCSDQARLTFIGLWTYVDDEGRGIDDARLVRAALWPLDDRSLEVVDGYLAELARERLIVRYRGEDGRDCFAIRNWKEHQRVDRPTLSKLPPPPELGDSPNIRRGLAEDSRASRAPAEGSREQGMEQGEEQKQNPPGDAGASASLALVESEVGVLPTASRPLVPGLLTLDPQRRVTGGQVLCEWIRLQPAAPSESERAKQGAAAKRLAQSHTAAEIGAAFLGIGQVWPHAPPKSEPWDLFDLEKRFPKALAAAANHPEVRRRREDAEFDLTLNAAGYG